MWRTSHKVCCTGVCTAVRKNYHLHTKWHAKNINNNLVWLVKCSETDVWADDTRSHMMRPFDHLLIAGTTCRVPAESLSCCTEKDIDMKAIKTAGLFFICVVLPHGKMENMSTAACKNRLIQRADLLKAGRWSAGNYSRYSRDQLPSLGFMNISQ